MKTFFKALEEKVYRYKKSYERKPKKVAMHLLMWTVKSLFKKWAIPKNQNKPKNYVKNGVLFNLQGGLGDILIAVNYLIQLKSKLDKNIVFYVTLPDVLQKSAKKFIKDSDVLELIEPADKSHKDWMLDIDLCRIPHIRFVDFNFVKQASDKLYDWASEVYEFNKKYSEYSFKPGTINDFALTKFTQMHGRNRLSQADINNFVNVQDVLSLKISDEQEILSQLGLDNSKYITMQCGTGVYSGDVMSTREWPINNFNELIKLIKQKRPDIKIVQIGNAKDLRMNVDIDLCGVTNFDEFLAILKNAMLHIGGESGPVHMRHFMGARQSVVLFGPTNADFYGYPENINISSDVCPGCEWLHRDWQKYCCMSDGKPLCMLKLSPKFVFNHLTKLL